MDDRVYILLDIVDGKAEQLARVLQESPGVVMTDAVEGPPEVIVAIEATEREQLAKLTVQALASVENITENVRLLPVRDRSNSATKSKLFPRRHPYGKTRSSKPFYSSNQVNSIS